MSATGLAAGGIFAGVVAMLVAATTPAHAAATVLDEPAAGLRVGFNVQVRAELDPHEASLRFRRAWLDLRGHVLHRDLGFRVQPDFSSGRVSMRDLFLEQRLDETWSLRAGQYTVPHSFARTSGSPNQSLPELGITADAFDVPQGRALGLGLEGRGDERRWLASAGLFDGRGRLDRRGDRPADSGHVLGLRGVLAARGEAPPNNTTASIDQPVLAFGLGLQQARRSYLRDWSLATRATASDAPADWWSVTVDMVAGNADGLLYVGLFHRSVSPAGRASHRDLGGEAEFTRRLGQRGLELVLRHSRSRLDVGRTVPGAAEGWQREHTLGLNLYHRAHRWKSQLALVNLDDGADWTLQLQHQVRY